MKFNEQEEGGSNNPYAWIYPAMQVAEVAAWSWDIVHDRIEFTDQARTIHGLPADGMISYRGWIMVVHEDDQPMLHQTIQRAISAKTKFRSEYRIANPDVGERWVEVRGGGIYDGAGKAIGLTGVVFDIAERKRAELAMKRQHQALAHLARVSTLGEISAALAHELNQPLAAILCNAHAGRRFLEQAPVNLEELRAIFSDIVADAERAGAVVARLRGLVKKEEAVRQVLSVNTLVEEIVQLLHSELITRQVSLTMQLNKDLPGVIGDPVQVRQVLLNLMMNAIEAMDVSADARLLRIETSLHDEDNIEVAVADAGPGIPLQMREKIFEPFVSGKPQGLGVGLAISRTIAVVHGGRLWGDNAPEGGAVMHFVLPICTS